MTNQERYITAFRKMEEKYRDPYGLIFFDDEHCSLCQIVSSLYPGSSCQGCPLILEEYRMHCGQFISFREAANTLTKLRFSTGIVVNTYAGTFPSKEKIGLQHKRALKNALTAFENRADFHKAVADLLETLPSKRFTKKGWIGFPEILEIESI